MIADFWERGKIAVKSSRKGAELHEGKNFHAEAQRSKRRRVVVRDFIVLMTSCDVV